MSKLALALLIISPTVASAGELTIGCWNDLADNLNTCQLLTSTYLNNIGCQVNGFNISTESKEITYDTAYCGDSHRITEASDFSNLLFIVSNKCPAGMEISKWTLVNTIPQESKFYFCKTKI